MAWFKVSDGRLRYRGRISRQPFAAWAVTEDGRAAVDAAASRLGFCLLGRARTARRRMWKALAAAAADTRVRELLDREPERFLAVWIALAYAPALPRLQVALRRLVVVPRTMIAGRALAGLTARLQTVPAFAALDAAVRAFFCERVVLEMDEAVRRAAPTLRRPVETGEGWACVALDDRFMWVDPLWSGRDWQGHVVMFEAPAEGLPRRERHQVDAAIERLQGSLTSLSAAQRDGAVRSAAAAMQPARA